MTTSASIQRILLVLLVGTLWVIGYVVAPTLFAVLDDRVMAGQIAGRMFYVGALVELAAGATLLFSALISDAKSLSRARYRLLMLMLVGIGLLQFGLNPVVAGARGTESFAMLHGVSAICYLLLSALGLLMVFMWESSQDNK